MKHLADRLVMLALKSCVQRGSVRINVKNSSDES